MPRSKTTESRNTFTGIRKLSKKVSKQGKDKSNKNNTTTEEMLDILSTESNEPKFKGKKQPMQTMQQQPMQTMQQQPMQIMQQQPMQTMQQQQLDDIDPLMISNFVPTNNQGEMYNINKIGDLLGMTQIGNPVLSTDSTIQNPMFEQQNPMAQQLTNQLMQQPMMQQPMMQQPMMQQQQFMGQSIDNNFMNNIKNLSGLYKTPKLV
jgi:hypothetical protein